MNTLEKMRKVADLLLTQNKINEAFIIYDELYRQIWGIIATIQKRQSGYLNIFFGAHTSPKGAHCGQYSEAFMNTICLRVFRMNLSTVLNEFTLVLFGRLRCISLSRLMSNELSHDRILTEFAILYTLALQPIHFKKITPALSIAEAILDSSMQFKQIQAHCSPQTIDTILSENARKCKTGEWKVLNHVLLDYLMKTGARKSNLFKKISNVVGPIPFHFQNTSSHSSDENQHNGSRYYKKFHSHDSYSSRAFCSSLATEEEKKRYYGNLMGLAGKLTKEQIRSKYINLVSQYHPDKVQHLGPELRNLAESKTKEINAAYNWLKLKYNI